MGMRRYSMIEKTGVWVLLLSGRSRFVLGRPVFCEPKYESEEKIGNYTYLLLRLHFDSTLTK